MKNILRGLDIQAITKLTKSFPVTAILGPRQCGKTTISRKLSGDYYFDLENPRDLARFTNPQLLLEDLSGTIVIDEIQRKPELFPLLRYLVDNQKQKYIILGSASRELIRQSSETLAGRIAYYELAGFRLADIGTDNWKKLWLRGGLPLAYLAKNDQGSQEWRGQYITSFLERDIPQLGITIPAQTLRRFWIMLSDYHGQIINYSELGRSFGVSDMTVRKYIEILQGTFMVRVLQPWHANISKRTIKNPKIYLRDSGLYHSLLTITTVQELLTSSKLGASWEGFALEEVTKVIKQRSEDLFFWKTHTGTELDLFWRSRGKNWGIEFKHSDAPVLTKSMKFALADLDLERLWVIYPGKDKYDLAKNVSVLPIFNISELA